MVLRKSHKPSVLKHLGDTGSGKLEASIKNAEMFHKMDLMELSPPGKQSSRNGNTKAAPEVSQEAEYGSGVPHLFLLDG